MRAVTDVAWAQQGSSGLGRLGCWPMAINSGRQWLFSGLAAHLRLVLSPRPYPRQPWIPPLGGLCSGQCHPKVAVPRKWQTLAHPPRPWQMSTLTMPSGVRSSPSGAARSPTHLSHLPPTLGPTGVHVAPSAAERLAWVKVGGAFVDDHTCWPRVPGQCQRLPEVPGIHPLRPHAYVSPRPSPHLGNFQFPP